MQGTPTGVGLAKCELPVIPPVFGEGAASVALFERLSTRTRAGAAISVPSSYGFGEAIELRYSSALSNTQFQGLFLQVDTSVANTSTIRAAEFAARRSAAVAVGTIMGITSAAYTGNGVNTGNITDLIGANSEAQVDDTYTGTIARVIGHRVKLQTEDGTTYSAINSGLTQGVFGILIENEFVTGGKIADAAIGVKGQGSSESYTALIDARGTRLVAHDTDRVTLMKFLDSAGTLVDMSYDVSAGGLVFS